MKLHFKNARPITVSYGQLYIHYGTRQLTGVNAVRVIDYLRKCLGQVISVGDLVVNKEKKARFTRGIVWKITRASKNSAWVSVVNTANPNDLPTSYEKRGFIKIAGVKRLSICGYRAYGDVDGVDVGCQHFSRNDIERIIKVWDKENS